jgi:hypothetical protein
MIFPSQKITTEKQRGKAANKNISLAEPAENPEKQSNFL